MTWILLAIAFMLFGFLGARALADRRAEAMRSALEGMEPTGSTFEEHA